ncbi:MAG: arginyl-tRNA synthetase [Roseivirga sp.]|jgi:arginyl-tRNA synthetase
MIYTVGNEQDYHFKVLFAILKKLGYAWADSLSHLSYGMVDLPTGKMKSREGTVVDADDLMDQMITTAQKISEDLGKTEGLSESEKLATNRMIGLGALKYFILKVDPRKRMLFNPEESIEFQGNTGPFIQYTHARIKSLLRKGVEMNIPNIGVYQNLETVERELIKHILNFPAIVQEAASEQAPSVIANYTYELVKTYNGFYQQLAILNDEDAAAVHFRIDLSRKTAAVIAKGMKLLGIKVPEQM